VKSFIFNAMPHSPELFLLRWQTANCEKLWKSLRMRSVLDGGTACTHVIITAGMMHNIQDARDA
jgi:hypothetical protein